MSKSIKNPIDLFLRKKLHLLIDDDILHDVGFTMDDELALWCELRPRYDYSRMIYCDWRNAGNRACIRTHGFDSQKFNKIVERELMKLNKKAFDNFVAFMDFNEDNDPKWCFVTGLYIPPRFRGDVAVQPFKDGEWCYKEYYDKYLTHNVISEKLTEESELICIATKPDKPRDFTVRPRVKNNEKSIRKHIRDNPLMFAVEFRIEGSGQKDWKFLRSKFFLKPTGKGFTKMKDE